MLLDPGGLHAIQVNTDDTYHRPASYCTESASATLVSELLGRRAKMYPYEAQSLHAFALRLLLDADSLLTLPPVRLRSTRTLHRVCWSLLQQGHPPLQVAPLLKPNLTASAPRRMYRRRLPLPGWDFHPAVLIAPNWRT